MEAVLLGILKGGLLGLIGYIRGLGLISVEDLGLKGLWVPRSLINGSCANSWSWKSSRLGCWEGGFWG